MKNTSTFVFLVFIAAVVTSCASNTQKTNTINRSCYANDAIKKTEADSLKNEIVELIKFNNELNQSDPYERKVYLSNAHKVLGYYTELAQIGHPDGINFKCHIAQDHTASSFLRYDCFSYCLAATKVIDGLKDKLPIELQNDLDDFENNPTHKDRVQNAMSNMCIIK